MIVTTEFSGNTMETTAKRTAKEAFDIIIQGLTLQKTPSSTFISDESGNRDPFGFIIDDAPVNELTEEMDFFQINKDYLGGQWDDDACTVIELCQQIHDGLEPDEWDYQLGITAQSEGLT